MIVEGRGTVDCVLPFLGGMTMLTSSAVGSLDGVSLVRVFYDNSGADHEQPAAVDTGDAKTWVGQASKLLSQQWPKGGSVTAYSEKIIHEFNNSSNNFYGLPCSYVFVEGDNCIGHGRLTECFESAGGNAAAVTFIVISHDVRGHGFGSQLMSLLEIEAERLGFHYIYLWTKTAIGFYEKIGYQKCERVSLKRACLKKLASDEVESLEALLLKRYAKINRNSTSLKASTKQQRPKETILLPPDDDENSDIEDVWLRKRLVEQVGSIHMPLETRLEEMKIAFGSHPKSDELDWCYRILLLPWQAQIGPSCGLTALRMAREYFWTTALGNYGDEDGRQQQQLPSLLGEAQEREFTTDGEVFDANHLKELAEVVCGIDCDMWSVADLTPANVKGILANGGIFILPYDSNARTRLPAKVSGHSAHYGIIVGVAIGLGGEAQTDIESGPPRLRPLQEGDLTVGGKDYDHMYLLVQHGLSSNLSIAPWSDFMESNQQLVSVDEAKFGNANLDLKDRIIVCRGLHPHAMSDS